MIRARNLCQTLCDFYQFEQKRVATTPLKRLTIKRGSTSTAQLRKSFRKRSRKHGSLKEGSKMVDMDTQAGVEHFAFSEKFVFTITSRILRILIENIESVCSLDS